MPVVLPSIDFHAHHSPFGAFASFTLGRWGKGGGFGIEKDGPATQDVYVGIARPGEGVTALPFLRASDSSLSNWRTFAAEEITRSMGWASDTWTAGELTFRLLTPFGPVPDLAHLGDGDLRRHLCPAILAEISLDNTAGETEAYAFFGVGGGDPLRQLSYISQGAIRGVSRAGEWGFAVHADPNDPDATREIVSWDMEADIEAAMAGNPTYPHRLANRGCLLLRAPAGTTRRWVIALGFYRSGIATSGIAATYLYTRLFSDLESVLTYTLENADKYVALARTRDAELDAAPISDERRFLLAHATHSYHGCTMLLHDERGVMPRAPFSPTAPLHRPLWIVNEGEYRMMNTFDLTVDQAFWEMRFHPWTLKNALDMYVGNYSYTDAVQDATVPERPQYDGGIAFTHDMGNANQFSPPGTSSYEMPNRDDCFSYMSHEQLCNWCLCAAIYALPHPKSLTLSAALPEGKPGDILWLTARRATLHACLDSLLHRDGPNSEYDGIMNLDAARCGNGQEITTYDSLDASLGQARANLYLAVKTWAAYLALSRCFDALGEDERAVEAEEQAACAAATITRQWKDAEGVFPAVFEADSPGHNAQIVPAIEALIYPCLLGDVEAISPYGPYGELISDLRRHLKTVLAPGICIDSTSGGIKLSSSSDNTWMSKIFLCQFVAERVLGFSLPDTFDAAHAKWQREGDCRDYAFTDQVRSYDGKDLGSRFYPRGVTGIIWLI